MGLFEDIGQAVQTDKGIQALSGIIAHITAPEGFKGRATGAAVKSARGIQKVRRESEEKKQLFAAKQEAQKSDEANKAELLKLKQQKLIDDKTYNKAILKLKDRELDILTTKAETAARKSVKTTGTKIPQVIKEGIDEEMKDIPIRDRVQRARYRNALIASKYGAPRPKFTDIGGRRRDYRPKPDMIKGKEVYLGDIKKSENTLYIYIGGNNWEPIE